MRPLMTTVLIVGIVSLGGFWNETAAEENRECHSGILPEGRGVQFCFSPIVGFGWRLVDSEIGKTGLMAVDLVLEKGGYIPDHLSGESLWVGTERMTIHLYDARDGGSIRSATNILKILLGLPRVRRYRNGYRLTKKRRWRRGEMAEVSPFLKDKRYFVVLLHEGKLSVSGRKAAKVFLSKLEVNYSEIN